MLHDYTANTLNILNDWKASDILNLKIVDAHETE